ncbi:MAG TPA: PIG-L family deacetylase [Bryobacteraceae bacterium]|nr:PIG-L family deacetylase [Bryobacteraceae bacterium]
MASLTRRRLILSGLASAAATPAWQSPRKKFVVAGGHPGDPEYGCGGTVARLADMGHDVVLLYLNRGEKACPESAAGAAVNPRVAEAKRACEILKARPMFAGQCDAHAIVDPAHYEEFREIIRSESPDALFTHWPIDAHPDHRAMSSLCYDAWLKLGAQSGFYYYEVSDGSDTSMFVPSDYVDIASVETRKKAACYAHASQAPEKFYLLQSDVSRFRGIESGYRQAEAFLRHVRSPRALSF